MVGVSPIAQARVAVAINFRGVVPRSNHLGGSMETRKINSIMRNVKLWQHCDEVVRTLFIKEMRGRNDDEWNMRLCFKFFVQGWKAAEIQRIRDGLTNINTDQPPQPFVY
jgi:hypothetical protein